MYMHTFVYIYTCMHTQPNYCRSLIMQPHKLCHHHISMAPSHYLSYFLLCVTAYTDFLEGHVCWSQLVKELHCTSMHALWCAVTNTVKGESQKEMHHGNRKDNPLLPIHRGYSLNQQLIAGRFCRAPSWPKRPAICCWLIHIAMELLNQFAYIHWRA